MPKGFRAFLQSFLFIFIYLTIIVASTSAEPVVVSGGSSNDYESWVARLNDDRLMIIFDRNPDWASGDLYVSFSSDNGVNWTTPQVIISETGDQATLCFIQMPDDTIWLWYASNETGSYKIHKAWSIDGINWTQEGAINLGWGSTTHYDPTVILEPDGSLTMSYVVSGNGVYIAHKPEGGSWDTDRTQVSSSGYRARVMKHTNGTYLYAYHKRTGGQYDYDVFTTTSMDRINWTTHVQITTNMNSHDPFPNQMPDGSYMVYYAKYQAPAYNLCRRRSVDGITWESEEQITTDNVNNTQPHFFTEVDGLYLVWAHAIYYPDDHDVYFEKFELTAPYVSIGMIPDNTPINVPAGGSFTFTGILENNTAQSGFIDVAIYVKLPQGNMYGPIEMFYNIPLDPYENIIYYNVPQSIPLSAAPGEYKYYAFCGEFPSNPYDSAWFPFTITSTTSVDGDDWPEPDWFNEDNNNMPLEYELLSNYPNPFNTKTNISIVVKEKSPVKLEIFNLAGQKIETLIDYCLTEGKHDITWDATGYSSGIYFYKLTTGNRIYTNRMTLLK